MDIFKTYRATMASYGSFTLNADGTTTASQNMSSGTPVENIAGTWSVSPDGKLPLVTGQSMTFTLESSDATLSLWRGRNAEGPVHLYHNGLSQAIDYYTAGGLTLRFSTDILAGRKAFWPDSAGYGSISFMADGTFTRSNDHTDGSIPVESVSGTWRVDSAGRLVLSPGFGVADTLVMSGNNVSGRYWLTSPAGSSMTQRWYYDQSSVLSSAIAHYTSSR